MKSGGMPTRCTFPAVSSVSSFGMSLTGEDKTPRPCSRSAANIFTSINFCSQHQVKLDTTTPPPTDVDFFSFRQSSPSLSHLERPDSPTSSYYSAAFGYDDSDLDELTQHLFNLDIDSIPPSQQSPTSPMRSTLIPDLSLNLTTVLPISFPLRSTPIPSATSWKSCWMHQHLAPYPTVLLTPKDPVSNTCLISCPIAVCRHRTGILRMTEPRALLTPKVHVSKPCHVGSLGLLPIR
ncbi:hypothetical protein B0H65DRAFT_474689 [Neurospora tetraspora]|uniref:Uncharacterized protein n=1 Tax=Neurospora tetraspora TaxID=94610 RepID=A0AAE0J9I6_9PEZI|nr:hypothetical protein B0H65DRAFT_474689 [Neurospora tetraspora]